MSTSRKPLVWAVFGFIIGGLLGGVGGYIVNDLTSRENPEVVEQMRQEQQRQENIDNLLKEIGSQPAGSSSPEKPEGAAPARNSSNSVGSGDGE